MPVPTTPEGRRPPATGDEHRPASTPEGRRPPATGDEHRPASTAEGRRPLATGDEHRPASTAEGHRPRSTHPEGTRPVAAAPKWRRRKQDRPGDIIAAALGVFAEKGFAGAK